MFNLWVEIIKILKLFVPFEIQEKLFSQIYQKTRLTKIICK